MLVNKLVNQTLQGNVPASDSEPEFLDRSNYKNKFVIVNNLHPLKTIHAKTIYPGSITIKS